MNLNGISKLGVAVFLVGWVMLVFFSTNVVNEYALVKEYVVNFHKLAMSLATIASGFALIVEGILTEIRDILKKSPRDIASATKTEISAELRLIMSSYSPNGAIAEEIMELKQQHTKRGLSTEERQQLDKLRSQLS